MVQCVSELKNRASNIYSYQSVNPGVLDSIRKVSWKYYAVEKLKTSNHFFLCVVQWQTLRRTHTECVSIKNECLLNKVWTWINCRQSLTILQIEFNGKPQIKANERKLWKKRMFNVQSLCIRIVHISYSHISLKALSIGNVFQLIFDLI